MNNVLFVVVLVLSVSITSIIYNVKACRDEEKMREYVKHIVAYYEDIMGKQYVNSGEKKYVLELTEEEYKIIMEALMKNKEK